MERPSKTLSKKFIRAIQEGCKESNILSNETIDNLSGELLASERFLNASANTLSVIGVWGPKIMASAIALVVVCRGVYETLKPNNDSEEDDATAGSDNDSEGEDSGVEDSDPEDN